MDDDIARIQQARMAFVSTPYIVTILEHMDRCRRYSGFNAEPVCMMVFGASGVGKSAIIRKYQKQHVGDSTPNGDIIPVVDVVLPENAKPVNAAKAILLKLNDPLALYENDEAILTERIVELVPLLKIELFIIDEFQHLVEKSSNRILHDVGDWLKILIYKTKRPFILFGMPYSKVVLNANSQLQGRFSVQLYLRPFSYLNGKLLFTGFLTQLDKALPFENKSGLEAEVITKKLYAFSGGNMRSLRDLIYHASVSAIENNRKSIQNTDFLYASKLLSYGKESTWKNPFAKGVKVSKAMLADPPKSLGWEDYLRNNKSRRNSIDLSNLF